MCNRKIAPHLRNALQKSQKVTTIISQSREIQSLNSPYMEMACPYKTIG